MLGSSLCDGNIAAAPATANNVNKKVVFKNCAPFTNCISRTNNAQVDDAHDIHVVMPMYNLIEYSDISKTSGILWQYCRDEPALDDDDAITDFNVAYTNSFKIKEKVAGQTGGNRTKKAEIMVPLKYLTNFWRTLEMPLIDCEANPDLNLSKKCVIVATAVADQGSTLSVTLCSSRNFINGK